MLRRFNPINKLNSAAAVAIASTTLSVHNNSSNVLFRFNSTNNNSNTSENNNNNSSANTTTTTTTPEPAEQKKRAAAPRNNNNNGNNNNTTGSGTAGLQIPQGLEVYLSCVGIIAGWWYWNEASYRQVDRACEKIESSAKERTNKLNEAVQSTEKRWHDDVKGKENLLNKVQHENVRLAKMLDEVSNYLKKCNVPQP